MTFKLHKDFIMAVSKLWEVTNSYNIIDVLANAPFMLLLYMKERFLSWQSMANHEWGMHICLLEMVVINQGCSIQENCICSTI